MRRPDKIFDNSFNKGEMDFINLPKVEVDKSYANRVDQYRNAYDQGRKVILYETILQLYQESGYLDEYRRLKKVPKNTLSEVFILVKEGISDSSFTHCEVFVMIAEMLGVTYNTLFAEVPPKYKEQVLKELDDEYKIFSRDKKHTQLF